jgi:hypothetical protein
MFHGMVFVSWLMDEGVDFVIYGSGGCDLWQPTAPHGTSHDQGFVVAGHVSIPHSYSLGWDIYGGMFEKKLIFLSGIE